MGDKACFDSICKDDMLFSGGLGLTSYEYMQLIFNLEKEHDILFDSSVWEYEGIMSVDDLISHIQVQNGTVESMNYVNDPSFAFHKIIEWNSRYMGDRTAIIREDGNDITYEHLWKLIYNEINELSERGLQRSDSILFYLPNSIPFVVHFFACAYLGLRIILCDTKLGPELSDIIRENQVSSILVNQATSKYIDQFILEHEFFKGSVKNVDKMSQYAIGKHVPMDLETNVDAISVVLYTSGTEGKPKGVANSYRNISEAIKNYCNTVDINNNDKLIAVAPFFHSYAMGSCLLAGFACGASMIIMDSFFPQRVLDAIEKQKATIFHGVPYMYKMLNHCLQKTNIDISSLRLCINAAGRLSLSEAKRFYQLTGRVIHQEYGSTETGTIAFSRDNSFQLDMDCVGEPLVGVNVRIDDPDDSGVGRITVTSKAIARGYVNSDGFLNTCYKTCDLGYIDQHGRIVLMGRLNRIINISGIKINSYEVEEAINSHPKVKISYVFGVENSDFGESVKALVVRSDNSLDKNELIAFCKSRLAIHKVPTLIEWRDSLDLSQLGKIKMSNQ